MPVDFSKIPLDPNAPAPYGYLVPPDTSNMPLEMVSLIRNQTYPGGTPIPQGEYDQKINAYMATHNPELYGAMQQIGALQGFSAPTVAELQRQWVAPAMAAPPTSGSVAVTPQQVQQMRDTQAAGGLYSVLNPSANIAPATTQAKVAAQQAVYVGNYTSAADMINAIRGYASGAPPAPPQTVTPTTTIPTTTDTAATNLPATPYTPASTPTPKISTRIPGFSAPSTSSFRVPNLARATQKRWSNFPTTTY